MKIAIMESIITDGGHEVDFDRILTEELTGLGHQPYFYVPEQFTFKFDYQVPVRYLPGASRSYQGVRGLRKLAVSAVKEINRQRWFRATYTAANQGEFDAVIVPTSTYRYLRALKFNPLKNSPVPVIFILHGINPEEAPSFYREAKQLTGNANIKMVVLTLDKEGQDADFSNIYYRKPPVFTPRDLDYQPALKKDGVLRLGFFGQYRREKNLEGFLKTFLTCKFTQAVELAVQGATVHPDDASDFERLIQKYQDHKNISFLHKGLIGREWQEAIAGVDALIMPYDAERYRYHWSAMLFTAIGYFKPVVVSSVINPEILAQYDLGVAFASGTEGGLKTALETFVNTYSSKVDICENALITANADFSPKKFVSELVGLIR